MSAGECSGLNGNSLGTDTCTCSGGSGSSCKSTGEPCCGDASASKGKKPSSLSSLAQNLRRGRPLNFTNKRVRKCGRPSKEAAGAPAAGKKSPKWVMKFNCAKRERKCAEEVGGPKCCVCTCYRRTDELQPSAGAESESSSGEEQAAAAAAVMAAAAPAPSDEPPPAAAPPDEDGAAAADLYGNIGAGPDPTCPDTPVDDCEERARLQRAREIAEGVEPPANFRPVRRLQLVCGPEGARRLQLVCPADVPVDSLRALFQLHVTLRACPLAAAAGCHTQVDYVHCLVPDLLSISNCSFYWGKMDRYEAERLLDGRPEGTFLLRDSAQEEFLFSVSFRKYGRSLHARIEQWNHKFSFDSHDPSVFASRTVCGLIEHYKDPSSCMFFEPMLTLPLHRTFAFPLQHLCRAVITSRLAYDTVSQLHLPRSLKGYLREYHYRQKVRVERFDDDVQWLDFRNLN